MSNILENLTSKNNPFIVPKDYFDRLPERIMKRILAGHQDKDSSEISSISSFGVPSGYFDKLENTILKRIALDQVSIENEEAFLEFAAPTLFSQKKTQDFQVPDNYFEQLEASVWNRIRIDGLSEKELDGNLNTLNLPASIGMEVTPAYFEDLESKIWSKITSEQVDEDLEELFFAESAPTLHAIPKTNPFSIPPHYFNQFDQNLTQTLGHENPDTKVIQLPIAKPNLVIRYIGISISVAASLVLIVSLGNFIFTNNSDKPAVASVEPSVSNPSPAQNMPLAEVVKNEQSATVVSFDEEDILEVVSENIDLSDLNTFTIPVDQPSQDEIIDYLVDTDIDLQSIDL
ncbi:MAG: hypothetical protein K1X82_02405 [Bacteroidia bacterium]|nr:hypothetical protein [Bacteroidia bacterium]